MSGICARACSPRVATDITLYDRLKFLYRAHMAALSALFLMNADINTGGIRMLMHTGEGSVGSPAGPRIRYGCANRDGLNCC